MMCWLPSSWPICPSAGQPPSGRRAPQPTCSDWAGSSCAGTCRGAQAPCAPGLWLPLRCWCWVQGVPAVKLAASSTLVGRRRSHRSTCWFASGHKSTGHGASGAGLVVEFLARTVMLSCAAGHSYSPSELESLAAACTVPWSAPPRVTLTRSTMWLAERRSKASTSPAAAQGMWLFSMLLPAWQQGLGCWYAAGLSGAAGAGCIAVQNCAAVQPGCCCITAGRRWQGGCATTPEWPMIADRLSACLHACLIDLLQRVCGTYMDGRE